MSKTRTKSKSQYAKSKEENPKTIYRSLSKRKSKSRNSPGISRVLRKRNAKYVSSPQINKLIERISSEEGNSLYPSLMNAVFSNQNICIFPNDISILVQGYNSYTDYIPLNQSFSIEEYKDFEKHIIGYNLELYQKMFLKNFEKVWYEDTSKFEKECLKDVIIFPIDLTLYGIEVGFTPFFHGRHASFLLVDKKNKKAYYIDSQDNKKEEKAKQISQEVYTKKKMEQYICLKGEAWIYHLLGVRIKVEVLDVEAPQTITNDNYCSFWAIMLADTIIRYYDTKGKVEPKKVIQSIRKKYNTREKLNTLIRRYISYVKSIEEEHFPEPIKIIPEPIKKKTFWQKIKDYIEKF